MFCADWRSLYKSCCGRSVVWQWALIQCCCFELTVIRVFLKWKKKYSHLSELTAWAYLHQGDRAGTHEPTKEEKRRVIVGPAQMCTRVHVSDGGISMQFIFWTWQHKQLCDSSTTAHWGTSICMTDSSMSLHFPTLMPQADGAEPKFSAASFSLAINILSWYN